MVDSATLYVGVPINLGAGLDRGQIHKSTDGGATWARQAVPPNAAITCLSAVSAGAAYASSSTGNRVLKLNAAGTAWDTLSTGLDKGLLSISVVDAQTVYASGRKGALIKTIDGGKTWIPQIIRTESDLVDIDAVNGENALVVGTERVIFWTAGHPSGLGPIAFRSGRTGRPARPVLGDGLLHSPGEHRTWDMRGRSLMKRVRQRVILGPF